MSNQVEILKKSDAHTQQANEEMARHNRLIEKVEADKVEIAQLQERRLEKQEKRFEKAAELDYRAKELEIKAKEFELKTLQFRHFKSLKHNMTDDELVAQFPEMSCFVSATPMLTRKIWMTTAINGQQQLHIY